MADRTLGQAAYEAYSAAVPYRCPAWQKLGPVMRAAWEAAATAAIEACGGSDG